MVYGEKNLPRRRSSPNFLVASAINVITSATSGNYPESFRIHEFNMNWRFLKDMFFPFTSWIPPMLGIVNHFLSTTSTTSQANGPGFLACFLWLVYQPAGMSRARIHSFFFCNRCFTEIFGPRETTNNLVDSIYIYIYIYIYKTMPI